MTKRNYFEATGGTTPVSLGGKEERKMTHNFPDNMFIEIGIQPPKEQPNDFLATLMYVLRIVASPRDSKAFLMHFKDNMTYDEIGEAFGVSRQRAHVLVQGIVDKITGDYAEMLRKGINQYMEDMLNLRISEIESALPIEEKKEIEKEAFAQGYNKGYEDGVLNRGKGGASVDIIADIPIEQLSLSIRSYNALRRNHVKTLGELLDRGDEIINFEYFGKTCFHELVSLLEDYDICASTYFPKAIMRWGEK